MSEMDGRQCLNPMILGVGFEDVPGVICGVARAFVTRSGQMICFGAAVDFEDKRLEHGQYERHAGTLLWVPVAVQVAEACQQGYTLSQLLTGADKGIEWKTII